ncbi:hypothetical protein AZ468_23750 (plasmid) [Vibrio europaeus]|uniref:Uncharacterized protein n=1 Tax=Vibrio europaeus TaxID=300876 RepID=A0A178J4A2_9VIBR|nr:hypothetical protein AZ468_23750 [Vibrio europaeus]
MTRAGISLWGSVVFALACDLSPPQSLQHKGKVHAGALVLANREWGMDRPATTTYPQHRREPMNHLPLTHTVHGDADHVRSLFAQEDKRNAS